MAIPCVMLGMAISLFAPLEKCQSKYCDFTISLFDTNRRRFFFWERFQKTLNEFQYIAILPKFEINSKSLPVIHKVEHINVNDAVSALKKVVRCHNVFQVIVFYGFKRPVFAVFGFLAVGDRIRHLHI